MSRARELTERFYEWETRGRGWHRYSYPVALEPPFGIFLRDPPQPARPLDDGRRHTFFSGLLESLKLGSAPPEVVDAENEPEVLPERVSVESDRAEVHLLLREDSPVHPQVVERALGTLVSCGALSFEVLGNRGGVAVGLGGARDELHLARQSLQSFFPDLVVEEPRAGLGERFLPTEGSFYSIIECGLSREFMIPLPSLRSLSPDPLAPLVGTLGALPETGLGVLQVLFEHVRAPWAEATLDAVTTSSGEPFFADLPEIVKLAREKVASPLVAVVIRIGAVGEREGEVWDTVRAMLGALSQLGSPEGNELIPLPGEPDSLLEDLLSRSTHRPGMLLSLRELVGLVHPLGEGVRDPRLLRPRLRSKAVPEFLMRSGLHLGRNRHRGVAVEVYLPDDERLKHLHVIGASGTGKSTLLLRMILEDITRGFGVGVIDPHGDLVDEVLARMPAGRENDVVLLDPADPHFVVGFNILWAETELERELLASDLVGVFRRLATSWGDQMTTVLANSVLAFLHSSQGGTLLDLRRFLVDPKWRSSFLETVRDPHLKSFWAEEFPLLVGKRPQAPILTRLDTFLRGRRIREVVTVRPGLDVRALIDSGKIILARFAQGALGVENASLLGSLLVAKIHQVVLARQEIREHERRPFFLYLDEFHEVATPSMATLFSGMRKFGLGLTVAHQDLYQLHTKAPDVERSVLGNAYSRICFRLGEQDAQVFAKGMASFSAEDLLALSVGEALCRVGRRDGDFNLETERLPPLSVREADERRREVRECSLKRFGTPRVEVEERDEAPVEVRREAEKRKPPERKSEEPQLAKEELDYLEHVATHPFLSVRERNHALSLSAWKGQQIKTALQEAKLVEEVSVNPGGRGEHFKLLEITGTGRALLQSFSIRLPHGYGRGGILHQWWANRIAEWLREKGIETAIEDESRGVRVDLCLRPPEGDIAIEIEMGEGHVLANIEKDRGAGFATVVTLLDDPGAVLRIRKKLHRDGELPEGVHLGDLRDFETLLTSLLSSSLRAPNENKERSGVRVRRRRGVETPRREGAPRVRTVRLEEPGAYTTPLAAQYLGLSPATLETMRTRGGGPVFVKLGRRVVYRKEDLEAWLVESRRRSTSDEG